MNANNNFPKISIVTPNYNYGHFLEETILSVISQGYPNLEYIIIDGGSTDNSIEIIKKYQQHLTYWISEPDKGVYDAVNKGFKKSTGDIMAYLNSDDLYLPWSLKTVAEIFSAFPKVSWLSTLQPGYIDYLSKSRWFGYLPGFSKKCFLKGYYAGLYSKYRFIQQESTFWRKELWENVEGEIDLKYKLAGDFYLWNEFYKNTELFGVNNPLSLFRSNEHQKSARIEIYINECLSILENNSPVKSLSPIITTAVLKLKKLQISAILFLTKKALEYHGEIIKIESIGNEQAEWKIRECKFNFLEL